MKNIYMYWSAIDPAALLHTLSKFYTLNTGRNLISLEKKNAIFSVLVSNLNMGFDKCST